MAGLNVDLLDKVKECLDDSEQTAQEIAEKSGLSVQVVRQAASILNAKGYAMTITGKPMRYRRTTPIIHERQIREDYQGGPQPYLRPGSYTPPEQRVYNYNRRED